MKISLLFLGIIISTGFAEEYSVRYDDGYSYVVDLSGGSIKAVYLAKKNKDGLTRIPQTVRIDGTKFSILCDLESTSPSGAKLIGVANVKGEVEIMKNSVPKIGEHAGSLLKK